MSFTRQINSAVDIVTGSAHSELAERTASELGVSLDDIELRRFPNSELYVRYSNSIRGDHVIIIQSLVANNGLSVNDALMELILMIDAAKRASASEITVVMPYMAYSRQDRKAKGREPISAATVINLLQTAGAKRLVSIDMHSAQTQAVFDGPFDHLTAEGVIRDALKDYIKTNPDNYIMVSPDGGRAKTAEHYASELGIDMVYIPKTRNRNDSSQLSRPEFVEGVKDAVCILIDDMIDTAGTLVSAAQTLKNSNAKKVIAAASHGLFSDPALSRLKESVIDELFITDTVPFDNAKKMLGKRLHIITIAPMLALALEAIIAGDSVSEIFQGNNYL
jgi:ribose-phosphate pyrophosphokinase